MENTKKEEMKACGCCPTGCACGDCACCKEGASCEKGCCGSNAACSTNTGGCPSCSRFRASCRICKLGKLAFWLLVILALSKLAFGGFGGHMRGGMMGGCGCGGDMMSGAMSGQMNCMKMERKGWFNWGRDDSQKMNGMMMTGS